MKKNIPLIVSNEAGFVVFESGPEAFESTHQCDSLNNKSGFCAGEDPCLIHAPGYKGKAFRDRCSLGFYVRMIPLKDDHKAVCQGNTGQGE